MSEEKVDLTADVGASVTIKKTRAPKESAIRINSEENKLLVDIARDGTMTFGEDYTPDEAAKVLWRCVAEYIGTGQKLHDAALAYGHSTLSEEDVALRKLAEAAAEYAAGFR